MTSPTRPDAARVEGNLLAAAQEVEKLKLMAEEGQITVETVQAAVADSAPNSTSICRAINNEPASPRARTSACFLFMVFSQSNSRNSNPVAAAVGCDGLRSVSIVNR